MNKDAVLGVIRHLLTFGGGFLVTKGVADDASTAEAIGALITLIGFVWSIWVKRTAGTQGTSGTSGTSGTVVPLLMAVGLGLTLAGCASVAPGHDPVVVRAEQTISVAVDTIDVFLRTEYLNHEALFKVAPEIYKAAEELRRQAPGYIATARALVRSYKLNRTDQNKADMTTAVAVLDTALIEAQRHLAAANAKGAK